MTDLDAAFDRLEAFRAVQHAEHGGYTDAGVRRLQHAAGLGDAQRATLAARLPAVSEAAPGAVLLGVLLGLFARE